MSSSTHDPPHSPAVESSATKLWDDLPIELLELILTYVYRDDAKVLRLVSKSFERKVSPYFFRSVVVPFNSELQDMVKRDIQARNGESGKGKGKRLAIDDDNVLAEQSSLPWMQQPVGGDDTYRGHGYKVFAGFGRHIRNFGMSFEVTEDDLRRPPSKQLLDSYESFYGSYKWPPPSYRRFDKLASLERTADEMSHLRDAMEHLTGVKALGLSLNNGLGWMLGGEGVDHPHIRPKIFGSVFRAPPTNPRTAIPEITDLLRPGEALGPRALYFGRVLDIVRDRFAAIEGRARDNRHPRAEPTGAMLDDQATITDMVEPDQLGVLRTRTGNPAHAIPQPNAGGQLGRGRRIARRAAQALHQTGGAGQGNGGGQAWGIAPAPRGRGRGGPAARIPPWGLGMAPPFMQAGAAGPPGAPGFLAAHQLGAPPAGNLFPPALPNANEGAGAIRQAGAAPAVAPEPALHWSQIAADQNEPQAALQNGQRGNAGAQAVLADMAARVEAAGQQNTIAGVLLRANEHNYGTDNIAREGTLVPSQLTLTQKEWLLEADWAMRAFLQSYMLSIVDNKDIFQHVTVFTFAFLSSRFVPILSRGDFWSSFPMLEKLSLQISPDWRSMERADNEIVDTSTCPSDACDSVFWLLHNFIGKIESLVELDIGWVSSFGSTLSGVSALGHVLPAPVLPLDELFLTQQNLLIDLPFIRHLKLTNCYLTFGTLKNFIRRLQTRALSELTLDQVSLTADRSTRILQHLNHPTRNAAGLIPNNGPRLRATSWVAALNDIGPVKTIHDLESLDETPQPRLVDKINFIKCGYAASHMSSEVDFDANNDPQAQGQAAVAQLRRQHLQNMLPQSERAEGYARGMKTNDPHMAYLVHDLRSGEDNVLADEFGMTIDDDDDAGGDDNNNEIGDGNGDDADDAPGPEVIEVNGWGFGGLGRFSGTLQRG
ncbi:hypothetical protein C1H76_8195 [Elsinoe australis]|uniref:F-box domain-containing protein n=1 Tax=Elsinoe australis TaxID=40998 RepID=A0A4U7AND4_9PEZI|nr:hypothetical protein C1H76_8195 [Elsinoe australis]